MADDEAEMLWPHQGRSVRPLPRTPLRPGVNGDHDGKPLAVSRRDRGLSRYQTGYGLQVDCRKTNAGTQDGQVLEVSERGS